MSGPDTAAKALSSIDIRGLGKLSVAPDANAPLLVVFGGIPVGGVQSGVYMWKYMSQKIKDQFHIFVAVHEKVNGTLTYRFLMDTLKAKAITPSTQILYLFSGGYRPGMDLLTSNGPNAFSAIYLVDIWMGVTKRSGSTVPDFYKKLVDENAAKITFTYVHTLFGANNNEARDYIANEVGPARAILVAGGTMKDHMSTNTTAIGTLQ